MHLPIKDKVVGHQLHQTGVNQDTRRHRVKHTRGVIVCGRICRKGVADAQTNGHADRRAQRIEQGKQTQEPHAKELGHIGQTRAQTKTFKQLMEHNHREQHVELIVITFPLRRSERQTNNNRVEHDTQFQYKHTNHFGGARRVLLQHHFSTKAVALEVSLLGIRQIVLDLIGIHQIVLDLILR